MPVNCVGLGRLRLEGRRDSPYRGRYLDLTSNPDEVTRGQERHPFQGRYLDLISNPDEVTGGQERISFLGQYLDLDSNPAGVIGGREGLRFQEQYLDLIPKPEGLVAYSWQGGGWHVKLSLFIDSWFSPEGDAASRQGAG